MRADKASKIFEKELKDYTIKRVDSLTTSEDGKQIKNKSSHVVNIAIYNKGKRKIRKQKEDSYTISTIHIYSKSDVLSLSDEIELDGLIYVVLEEKVKRAYSFYKAIANV